MNLRNLPDVVVTVICNYINFIKDFNTSTMILPMPFYEENIKHFKRKKEAIIELCGNAGISINWLLQPHYKTLWQNDEQCWRALCRNPNIPCSFFDRNFQFIKTTKNGLLQLQNAIRMPSMVTTYKHEKG